MSSDEDITTPLVEERREVKPGYLPKEEIEWEFGGPVGALGMMVGFPLLMYYMWISAQFYDGKPAWPAENQTWKEFVAGDLFQYFVKYGIPSFKSWFIFTLFILVQAAFYLTFARYLDQGSTIDSFKQ